MKQLPTLLYEEEQWQNGFSVVGMDEVGRGAFAGPVVVSGVSFVSPDISMKEYLLTLGINDSKKVSPKNRALLSSIIKEQSVWHTSFIDVEVVNEIGIGMATFEGMKEVYRVLQEKVDNPYLLIDAFEIPDLKNQKGIIRGDSISLSIAAASIIAKVERDNYMEIIGEEYPHYEWGVNKGYGTLKHRTALKEYGLSPYHRTVFCQSSL